MHKKKSSHIRNTKVPKARVPDNCNPLKARLFQYEKKDKYSSPKGGNICLGIQLYNESVVTHALTRGLATGLKVAARFSVL